MRTEAQILENKIRKQFDKGCVDFNLLADGDRILIALSGGKDSLELLRLLAQRSRIYRPHIEVEAAHVIMDNIPYETDRTYLQQFCDQQGIRLHILHSSFDESTDPRKTRCFLCSWNRRKTLFRFAVDHHFNKIALGHHMDDILTTLLLNMTFEGRHDTILPSTVLTHYPIILIRPLCLVHESHIRELSTLLGFQKQKTPCPYETTTKRHTMQQLLNQIESINPEARYNLWHSFFAQSQGSSKE